MQRKAINAAPVNGKEAVYFGVPGKMPTDTHRRSSLVTRSMSPASSATTTRGT